ncbi:hypothetical protein CEXT_161 [Caerostris extrusa]|uniref:Uncharacterized protein n=1 Tax=Caerostris extrusa TaxID=172846 RepID=A0AAV4P782_CAEEX|nr:hypothetical protein CEXT_161 [Caerostris extrusa]
MQLPNSIHHTLSSFLPTKRLQESFKKKLFPHQNEKKWSRKTPQKTLNILFYVTLNGGPKKVEGRKTFPFNVPSRGALMRSDGEILIGLGWGGKKREKPLSLQYFAL